MDIIKKIGLTICVIYMIFLLIGCKKTEIEVPVVPEAIREGFDTTGWPEVTAWKRVLQ